MSDELKKKWGEQAAKLLVGRTIKSAGYMTDEECYGMGWDHAPLVIELDNGLCLFASGDDEGNEAGALFTSSDKHPGFPVI